LRKLASAWWIFPLVYAVEHGLFIYSIASATANNEP